jgi:hypothetical protein
MLKRVEAQIGQLGGFRMPENCKYTAMIVEFVVRQGDDGEELRGWVQQIPSR